MQRYLVEFHTLFYGQKAVFVLLIWQFGHEGHVGQTVRVGQVRHIVGAGHAGQAGVEQIESKIFTHCFLSFSVNPGRQIQIKTFYPFAKVIYFLTAFCWQLI